MPPSVLPGRMSDASADGPSGDSPEAREVQFGTGIAVGAVLGIVAALLAGNAAVWIGIGVGLGIAMDVANRSGMLNLQPDDEE